MINYREIPEVVETLQKFRETNKSLRETNIFKLEVGKKIILKVEITDLDLFFMVMGSMVDESYPLSVPGAKLEAVFIKDPVKMLAEEQAEWLENRAKELRERTFND